MAKELPYFKFYSSEWLNGDITLESFEIQGLFINICAYYWTKDCCLSKENLLKKFKGDKPLIDVLINSGFLKIVKDNVSISFLNEQIKSKEVRVVTNRINGSKGGRPPKPKPENNPIGFISETETEANNNPNITNIKESKVKESKVKESKEENKITFDVFWDLYNKKVGDKNACLKKWDKLPNETQQKIIDFIPTFLGSIKDKQFLPHPQTFLNQERWNDEIASLPNTSPTGYVQFTTEEDRKW